jgi:hypothetical protein
MAASKQRRLFEDLGLIDQPTEANPYETLGLDQTFANNLLKEDPSGAALQFIAGALHKALSRRYHPDIPDTGDEDRFRAINEADTRITEASSAALVRWSKTERLNSASTSQVKGLQAERAAILGRAAELLQADLELGNHPQHFSQLSSAQGILLQRANTPLLMRQQPEGGMQVLMGRVSDLSKARATGNAQVFDFRAFLKQNDSFGLEPGTKIVTYIDDEGRASILKPDLTFIMDITDPVAKKRQKREKLSHAQRGEVSNKDFWSRSDDPLLFITSVPEAQNAQKPETQLVLFPSWAGPPGGGASLAWNIPMDTVGSVADQDFFGRMKHNKATENIALSGGATKRTMSHFNLLAAQTRQLLEHDPGYSPLLRAGNSLLLYDAANRVPVITDAKVMGMIGNNSKAI